MMIKRLKFGRVLSQSGDFADFLQPQKTLFYLLGQ
tara:strand:+ start:1070 stop:1174 length:105 start_codon:yes stop_codon:yes gene_type:complete